jgi:hypothetical protein
MRTTASLLVMSLIVTAGCSSVTEQVRENPETTIGAGAGAVGGALIGGLVTDSPAGPVVGGLLGGLAGGAAGHYLGRRDRTRRQAADALGYAPEQGKVVDLERVDSVPDVVNPGDRVNLAATYTVLTPDGGTVPVRELRFVRHDGELVADPSAEFRRANGTYTSALPITLPADARRAPTT